jgi:hypothetical protein
MFYFRTVSDSTRMSWSSIQDNGGGLFTDEMDSHAAKAIWDFEGIYATSRHSELGVVHQ